MASWKRSLSQSAPQAPPSRPSCPPSRRRSQRRQPHDTGRLYGGSSHRHDHVAQRAERGGRDHHNDRNDRYDGYANDHRYANNGDGRPGRYDGHDRRDPGYHDHPRELRTIPAGYDGRI